MANLIANGTFESNITGWTALYSTIARDTTASHTGVASLKITATAAGGGAYPAAIPVTVGKTYTISLWARGTGTMNIGMSNGSAFVAYSPNYVLSSTEQHIVFDWTATISSVLVYPELVAPGNVAYIDDVFFDAKPDVYVPPGIVGAPVRGGTASGTTSATTFPQATTKDNISVVVVDYNVTATTEPTVTVPGYTRIAFGTRSAGLPAVAAGTAIWAKVCTGSDAPPTITLSAAGQISWITTEVTGVYPVLPLPVTLTSDAQNTAIPISYTAAGDNDFMFAVLGGRGGATGIDPPTWPTGLTAGITSLSGTNAYSYFATGTVAHASDVYSGTIAISNSQLDRTNNSGIVGFATPVAPVVASSKGNLIRGGAKVPFTADSVIIGGAKKTVTPSILIGGTKKSLV